MFVDTIRRALAGSPRAELGQLSEALWKGYAAGAIGEDEAQQLADEIQARKAVPAPPVRPTPRRVGSRPQTSASMERRRRWTASGRMPPVLAARFTMAEQAVLALIAAEVSRRGDCRLTIGHLAAVAGVSASTVRNALRAAVTAGLVTIEERRLTYWRNLPNIIRIVSPGWRVWLRLRTLHPSDKGGCKSVQRTNTDSRKPIRNEATTRSQAWRWKGQARSSHP